ncbi:MAG TPA: hypothetical protein DD618_02730 [Acholeplasmatales bacterium]|nr:hypothetical protein [Acholeplasmatales bacterium]
MIKEFSIELISRIGEAPLCNGQADTTFQIFGFRFLLCYRCTFAALGLLLTVAVLNRLDWQKHLSQKSGLILALLLMSLLVIDGIAHYFFGQETTNLIRILSGMFAGMGSGLFVDALFYKTK